MDSLTVKVSSIPEILSQVGPRPKCYKIINLIKYVCLLQYPSVILPRGTCIKASYWTRRREFRGIPTAVTLLPPKFSFLFGHLMERRVIGAALVTLEEASQRPRQSTDPGKRRVDDAILKVPHRELRRLYGLSRVCDVQSQLPHPFC